MWLRKKAAPAEPEVSITIDPHLGDEGSRELTDLLKAREWARAAELLRAAPTAEHFARRVVAAADVEGLEAWIDDAIRAEPASTLPLLIKGARHVYWAWEARGSGYGSSVGQDARKAW